MRRRVRTAEVRISTRETIDEAGRLIPVYGIRKRVFVRILNVFLENQAGAAVIVPSEDFEGHLQTIPTPKTPANDGIPPVDKDVCFRRQGYRISAKCKTHHFTPLSGRAGPRRWGQSCRPPCTTPSGGVFPVAARCTGSARFGLPALA